MEERTERERGQVEVWTGSERERAHTLPAHQVRHGGAREAGWIRTMLREPPHLERCT